jgi:predicted Zn-dependent peptidase
MKPKSYKLNNGLKIVEDPIEGSNSFSLVIMFRTGSRNETVKIWGISHFLEHMAFKGTKIFPSPSLLTKKLDSLGAAYNAFTSKEHTGYYIKGSERVFEAAVDILSEMTIDPIIEDVEVDKERGAIVEELNMYEDDPARKVVDYFEESLYEDHQVAQEIGGTKESLKNIHAKEIIEYRQKYYRAGDTVVSIAGKIPTNFQSYIEGKFGVLEPGEEPYLPPVLEKKKMINVLKKETMQTHLVLGFPGLSVKDRDREIGRVLSTILGGNMSSRMFSEVREKRGLAYYIRTMSDNLYDTGALATVAGVNNEKVYEAVELIGNVYESVKTGLEEEELRRTKDYLSGIMTLNYEDNEIRAEINAMNTLYGLEPKSLEEKIAGIERVSAEEIQDLAKRLVDDRKICLALIGPSVDDAKFRAALKI